MTLAYLDTHSGIAGDMTLAALVDAGADRNYIEHQVHSLGLGQVHLRFSETERHCFRALRLDVEHPPEHAHRNLSTIEAMIVQSKLAPRERDLALRMFRRIGMAEAKVHGTTIEQVHFHEVGAVDSIVDIVGVSVAICNLNIRRIIASPTPVGAGTIRIAHGLVSVPAPATAELLRGIPLRNCNIAAELTTPTGAAILSTLVDSFGTLPDMQIQRIGYGAGHRQLVEQANVLRVLIGIPLAVEKDEVTVLETNLDDISGEQIGYAIEQLWKSGALDVFTTSIGMKKNRPGTLLTVLCRAEQRIGLEDSLFTHCGTLGIRRTTMARRMLPREVIRVATPLGTARAKVAWRTFASTGALEPQVSPEYEDCRAMAEASGQTLAAVFQMVIDAAEREAAALTPPAAMTSQWKFGESNTPTPPHMHGVREAHDHAHHDHDHDHHDHHDHDRDHHDHDHHHGH